jgi:hypothetical protein
VSHGSTIRVALDFKLRLFPQQPIPTFPNSESMNSNDVRINGPCPSFQSTTTIYSEFDLRESLSILLGYFPEYFSSESCGFIPRVPSRSNGLDSNCSLRLREDLYMLLENLLELQLPNLLIFFHLSPPDDGRFIFP